MGWFMYRKLLIYIFCVVLTGAFLVFGQDSQQADVQQNMGRPGNRMGMNRPERPDRGQNDGRSDGERGMRGRGNRPPRGDNMGGPPMPGQQPPPRQESVQQPEPTELEAVEEEDDTKSPLYGTPYLAIVKRNLFALKAGGGLGTAVTNIVPMSLSTNNLKFMGITTIGGVIKSHFMINKPGQQPPQQYISLTEGQASEGLECLKINPDPVNPTAEVRADGKQIEVSFETHGIKAGAPATPAPNNNRPNAQQQQQGGRGMPGQPPGGRMPGQPGQQWQTQQAQAGGFNLPAVNAANAANQAAQPPRPGQYAGWSPPSGGTSRTVGQTSGGSASSSGNNNYRRNMPMTQEANSYRNRGGNSSGGFSGGSNMPPMPPGM